MPPANPEHRLQDIPFRPEEGFVGGRVRRLSLFVRLAVAHAPAGGISIGGKQFTGGQFIPGEVLEKATKEEKAAVDGNGEAKARPKLKLQGNERQAMAAWVAGASTDIRAREFSDDITPSIQTFHDALDKFPKHKGIVFRGLTMDTDKFNELARLPKGFVFDFKASTSTSTKEKISRRFADPKDVFGEGEKSVMFRIGSETGADISSTNEEQGEVILRRGSKYQVTRITKGDGVDLVIHMEEIPAVKSVRLAQVHAPKGGVSIGGKQFKGGEFIPGDVLEKATPEEKAKIEGKGEEKPPGQKRAKIGGEIGPNGEWYNGGAFIATTDMSKKARVKRDFAAKGAVKVDFNKREVPKPGRKSIFDVVGVFMDARSGELNETAMQHFGADVNVVHDLAKRFQAGERWVDVNDYPKEAKFSDLARMAKSNVTISGEALATVLVREPKIDTADELKAALGVEGFNGGNPDIRMSVA